MNAAVQRDAPHTMITQIGDVEVAAPVQRHPVGVVQIRAIRRSPVAAESGEARARQGLDGSVRRDPPDAVVSRICDIEVTGKIRHHGFRLRETRRRRRIAVADVIGAGCCLDQVGHLAM